MGPPAPPGAPAAPCCSPCCPCTGEGLVLPLVPEASAPGPWAGPWSGARPLAVLSMDMSAGCCPMMATLRLVTCKIVTCGGFLGR